MNPLLEHFLKFMLVVLVAYAAGVNAFIKEGSAPVQQEPPSTQLAELVGSFALATLLVFILLKYFNASFLLKAIELISLAALSYVLAYFLSFNSLLAVAFSLFSVGLRLSSKEFAPIAPLILAAGGGAFFGVAIPLGVLVAFSLLLIVYDFVSVFITKHMVELAVRAERAGLSMAISSKGKVGRGKVKKVSGISMGLGDVVFPTAIAIAAFPVSPALSTALLFLIPVGYLLVIYMLAKLRVPLPALPPMLAPQLIALAFYISSTFI